MIIIGLLESTLVQAVIRQQSEVGVTRRRKATGGHVIYEYGNAVGIFSYGILSETLELNSRSCI